MKVLYFSFLSLHFDFVIFGTKNIGAKCARKMLMKFTSGQQNYFFGEFQLFV